MTRMELIQALQALSYKLYSADLEIDALKLDCPTGLREYLKEVKQDLDQLHLKVTHESVTDPV